MAQRLACMGTGEGMGEVRGGHSKLGGTKGRGEVVGAGGVGQNKVRSLLSGMRINEAVRSGLEWHTFMLKIHLEHIKKEMVMKGLIMNEGKADVGLRSRTITSAISLPYFMSL